MFMNDSTLLADVPSNRTLFEPPRTTVGCDLRRGPAEPQVDMAKNARSPIVLVEYIMLQDLEKTRDLVLKLRIDEVDNFWNYMDISTIFILGRTEKKNRKK
jgi:hypothetical protein